VQLTSAQAADANEMYSRVAATTEQLVQQHWRAIERVAAALRSQPGLNQDRIDALIADAAATRTSSLVAAKPEEYGRSYVIGGSKVAV